MARGNTFMGTSRPMQRGRGRNMYNRGRGAEGGGIIQRGYNNMNNNYNRPNYGGRIYYKPSPQGQISSLSSSSLSPWWSPGNDPRFYMYQQPNQYYRSNLSHPRAGYMQRGGRRLLPVRSRGGHFVNQQTNYSKGIGGTRAGGNRGGFAGKKAGTFGTSSWRRGGNRGGFRGGRGGRGGNNIVSKESLDSALEKYMGDDVVKGRLDSALDSYFGRDANDATMDSSIDTAGQNGADVSMEDVRAL